MELFIIMTVVIIVAVVAFLFFNLEIKLTPLKNLLKT